MLIMLITICIANLHMTLSLHSAKFLKLSAFKNLHKHNKLTV